MSVQAQKDSVSCGLHAIENVSLVLGYLLSGIYTAKVKLHGQYPLLVFVRPSILAWSLIKFVTGCWKHMVSGLLYSPKIWRRIAKDPFVLKQERLKVQEMLDKFQHSIVYVATAIFQACNQWWHPGDNWNQKTNAIYTASFGVRLHHQDYSIPVMVVLQVVCSMWLCHWIEQKDAGIWLSLYWTIFLQSWWTINWVRD